MTGFWDIVWLIICLRYLRKISHDPEPFLRLASLLNSGD
jgi:hypothetical protein